MLDPQQPSPQWNAGIRVGALQLAWIARAVDPSRH
jgi:hypothetical protein